MGKINTHCNEKISEQAQEAKRKYQREWAKKNRDKVKAAQRRYWEKKALQAVGRTNEE